MPFFPFRSPNVEQLQVFAASFRLGEYDVEDASECTGRAPPVIRYGAEAIPRLWGTVAKCFSDVEEVASVRKWGRGENDFGCEQATNRITPF